MSTLKYFVFLYLNVRWSHFFLSYLLLYIMRKITSREPGVT